MKYNLIIVVLLITFSSCDKYLDIKPKGKVIPTSVEDYRLILDQVDGKGKANGFVKTCYSDIYFCDDVKLSDDMLGKRYGISQQRMYLWNDYIYNEEVDDFDWKALYNQIYMANIVTEEVMDAKGDFATRNQLLAEAKVHRAFAYFILVNLYAKHYNEGTCGEDLGVPLRTNTELEGSLNRATVKEVYDFIIDELTSCIEYLPDFPKYNHRPSKASVYALFSRIYLYMGKFDLALDNANKTLGIYSELTDYNELNNHPRFTNMIELPDYYEDKEQLLVKQQLFSNVTVEISDELKSLFDTENDLRFCGVFDIDFAAPKREYIAYDEYIRGIRLKGLTVPEMMLTKAECLIRTKGDNGINEAMGIVENIRKKRIKPEAYTKLSYTSAKDVLNLVKLERRFEFVNKGIRWFDLKRYNSYGEFVTLRRVSEGKEYVLAPGDAGWVIPIALKYLALNPEIVPNR